MSMFVVLADDYAYEVQNTPQKTRTTEPTMLDRVTASNSFELTPGHVGMFLGARHKYVIQAREHIQTETKLRLHPLCVRGRRCGLPLPRSDSQEESASSGLPDALQHARQAFHRDRFRRRLRLFSRQVCARQTADQHSASDSGGRRRRKHPRSVLQRRGDDWAAAPEVLDDLREAPQLPGGVRERRRRRGPSVSAHLHPRQSVGSAKRSHGLSDLFDGRPLLALNALFRGHDGPF